MLKSTQPFINQSNTGGTATCYYDLNLRTRRAASVTALFCPRRMDRQLATDSTYKAGLFSLSPLTGFLTGLRPGLGNGIYLAYPRQCIATVLFNPATVGDDHAWRPGASFRWRLATGIRVTRRPYSDVRRDFML